MSTRITSPQSAPQAAARLVDLPVVYSFDETVELLRLGESTTRKLIQSGQIRVIRVGRRILVPRSSIEDFLAERAGEARTAASR